MGLFSRLGQIGMAPPPQQTLQPGMGPMSNADMQQMMGGGHAEAMRRLGPLPNFGQMGMPPPMPLTQMPTQAPPTKSPLDVKTLLRNRMMQGGGQIQPQFGSLHGLLGQPQSPQPQGMGPVSEDEMRLMMRRGY